MAEIKKNYPPTERSAGKRGDIWEDTTTGVKYKLCSIIDIKAGPDSVIYYQWYPIQTSSGGGTGEPGKNGKSAFEIAVENGFVGTETEWLASLKGQQGDKGDPGEKGDPFVYSDFTAEQLESLKGPQGDKGDPGEKGEKGDDGSLVVNVAKNSQIKSGLRGNILLADCTRNLLNPTLETTTKNGVTCTNNGDGTYTLNGTATTEINFDIGNINLQSKKYRITGTPLGYGIKDRVSLRNSDYSKTVGDWDAGNNFDGDIFKENCIVYILISSGSSFKNVIFKPMITTDLNATYDDFVPYSGYEIKTCGKNLFDILKCNYACNDGGSYTINGETLEINSTASSASGIYTHDMKEYFIENIGGKFKISFDAKATIGGDFALCEERNAEIINIGTEYERKVVEYTILNKPKAFIMYNYSGVAQTLYIKNFIIEKVDEFNGVPTPFEPYQVETITVTNDTEFPAFGLKSHGEVTNIITPANAKIVYPTIESSNTMLTKMQSLEEKLSAIKTS